MRSPTLSLLIIFMLVICLPALGQSWEEDFDSAWDRTVELRIDKKYPEALQVIQESLDVVIEKKDTSRAITGYLWIGALNNLIGNYDKAADTYRKGIQLALITSDSLKITQLSTNLTIALLYKGDYADALEPAKIALQYIPEEEIYQRARANLSIHVTYNSLGMHEIAEPYLMESQRLANLSNDILLKSQIYRYLGHHFRNRNQLDEAIRYFQEGLILTEEVGNRSRLILYYTALGNLYSDIKDFERALNYYNRAHAYYQSMNNDLLANEMLTSIAKCYRETGDYKEAEKLLHEVLAFYSTSDHPHYRGLTLLQLSDLFAEQGQYKNAFSYLEQAIEIGNVENDFRISYSSSERLLEFDSDFLTHEEKLRISKELYTASKKISPDSELSSLILLAKAYHPISLDSALAKAEQAFDLIEDARLSVSGGLLKASVFSKYASFYNTVGHWYAQEKKDYNRAFELFEAAKARALLDQLAESSSRDELRLNESTQVQLLQIQKSIDKLYRERESAQSEDLFDQITNEINDLEFKYDSKLEEVRGSHPAWNAFLYPETLSLKEVQELCDEETAILEYAITNNHLFMFVIKEESAAFKSVDLENAPSNLAAMINSFRDAIISLAPKDSLTLSSEPLYSLLIEPLKQEIENSKNLVMVPDGPLALLPFEALIQNGRYLIQEHSVKYLPSVSVFDHIKSPHREVSSDILALAGSGFEYGDTSGDPTTQKNFAALPFTLIEVDSIAVHFDTKTVFKNEEVTEATLKSIDLKNFKYIHFATHGDINETSPTQSGLILSKKTDVEQLFGEDGYLNASEISHLNLNADMVVLSACNTGLGKVITGEGLLGLQRSFLAAGASSVVSSLWSIYDRSTPLFMANFYTILNEYEEEEIGWFNSFLIWADWYEPELVDYKTLALRDAKLKMLEHPYYSHPAHWASFVITGK